MRDIPGFRRYCINVKGEVFSKSVEGVLKPVVVINGKVQLWKYIKIVSVSVSSLMKSVDFQRAPKVPEETPPRRKDRLFRVFKDSTYAIDGDFNLFKIHNKVKTKMKRNSNGEYTIIRNNKKVHYEGVVLLGMALRCAGLFRNRKDIGLSYRNHEMCEFGCVYDKRYPKVVLGRPDLKGNIILGEYPNTTIYNVFECLLEYDVDYRHVPNYNLEVGWSLGFYISITEKNSIRVSIDKTTGSDI